MNRYDLKHIPNKPFRDHIAPGSRVILRDRFQWNGVYEGLTGEAVENIYNPNHKVRVCWPKGNNFYRPTIDIPRQDLWVVG